VSLIASISARHAYQGRDHVSVPAEAHKTQIVLAWVGRGVSTLFCRLFDPFEDASSFVFDQTERQAHRVRAREHLNFVFGWGAALHVPSQREC